MTLLQSCDGAVDLNHVCTRAMPIIWEAFITECTHLSRAAPLSSFMYWTWQMRESQHLVRNDQNPFSAQCAPWIFNCIMNIHVISKGMGASYYMPEVCAADMECNLIRGTASKAELKVRNPLWQFSIHLSGIFGPNQVLIQGTYVKTA